MKLYMVLLFTTDQPDPEPQPNSPQASNFKIQTCEKLVNITITYS